MVPRKALAILSGALSAVVAAVSCTRGDYFWLLVSAFAIASLWIPSALRMGEGPSKGLLAWTMVPSALQLAFIAGDMTLPFFSDGSVALNDVPLFTYVSSFCMALQSFLSGLGVLASANASGRITISRVWMLVFAMMISLGMSAFCMFYEYGWMYLSGYEVGESDLASLPEGKFMNGLMMAMPIVTVISTFFFVIAGRLLLMRWPKDWLTEART